MIRSRLGRAVKQLGTSCPCRAWASFGLRKTGGQAIWTTHGSTGSRGKGQVRNSTRQRPISGRKAFQFSQPALDFLWPGMRPTSFNYRSFIVLWGRANEASPRLDAKRGIGLPAGLGIRLVDLAVAPYVQVVHYERRLCGFGCIAFFIAQPSVPTAPIPRQPVTALQKPLTN
jgi:hypothetical protein